MTTNMDDPWEVAAAIDQASKAGQHDEAFDLAEKGLARHTGSGRLRGAKAWALYRRDIRSLGDTPDLPHRQRAKRALDEITELVGDERYGNFSPVIRGTLRFSQALLDRFPKAALEILNTLDESQLDGTPSQDFPSDRGEWYLKTTAALKDLERWEDLATTASAALASASLRTDDDVWILHRLGLGYLKQGHWEEALEHLRTARARKPEWWLDLLIAEALLGLGESEEAKVLLARVAADNLRSPFAYRVFTLLGDLLRASDAGAARSCIQQARYLRSKADWSIDTETEEIARGLGVDLTPDVEPDQAALRTLLADLAPRQRGQGTVTKVLANGGSGFLALEDGTSLYFSMAPGETAPETGTQVRFTIIDGYDKKKDRPSEKAVDVQTV